MRLKLQILILFILGISLSYFSIEPQTLQADTITKSVSETIQGFTPQAQASYKGKEIAKLGSFTTTHGKYQIEITEMTPIDRGVEFYARVWEGGKAVSLGTGVEKEHFRIYNPPILVPDGTKRTEISDGRPFQVDNLKEDLREALLQGLSHTIDITKKQGIPKSGTVGNTTSTFYPDAGSGASTVDGFIRRQGQDQTWADIKAGAGTTVGKTDAALDWAQYVNSSTEDQFASLTRAIATFTTSTIGTDTISSATFSIFGSAKIDDNSDAPTIDVYAATPATNNNLVTGDFAQVGSTSQTGSAMAYASWSITGYNDFAFNATGIGNVNKTGVSAFGTRIANYDVGASTPPGWSDGGIESFRGYFADNGSNQPKLVVVHAPAAPAATTGANAKKKIILID